MKLDWKGLKNFITTNGLYNFVNYIDLVDNYYVWVAYQNENFYTLLDKGSVECEDFETNIKTKAILKKDIAPDGQTVTKITHVMSGRLLKALFTTFTTCTKEISDISGRFRVKLYNEAGVETDVAADVIKTCIDFCPNFTYEIYGGGIETIDDLENHDYFISGIIAPLIPSINNYFVINKKILSPKDQFLIEGVGTAEVLYNSQYPEASVLRIELRHPKGEQKKLQLQLQYYA